MAGGLWKLHAPARKWQRPKPRVDLAAPRRWALRAAAYVGFRLRSSRIGWPVLPGGGPRLIRGRRLLQRGGSVQVCVCWAGLPHARPSSVALGGPVPRPSSCISDGSSRASGGKAPGLGATPWPESPGRCQCTGSVTAGAWVPHTGRSRVALGLEVWTGPTQNHRVCSLLSAAPAGECRGTSHLRGASPPPWGLPHALGVSCALGASPHP